MAHRVSSPADGAHALAAVFRDMEGSCSCDWCLLLAISGRRRRPREAGLARLLRRSALDLGASYALTLTLLVAARIGLLVSVRGNGGEPLLSEPC